MVVEKILMVSDGVVTIFTGEPPRVGQIKNDQVSILVADYGVDLDIAGETVPLPGILLDHLLSTEGTNMHFYQVEPYSLVGLYKGAIALSRDELLKAKGAWEYSARP